MGSTSDIENLSRYESLNKTETTNRCNMKLNKNSIFYYAYQLLKIIQLLIIKIEFS